MMLVTSHITNTYTDLNEYCHDVDMNITTNINCHNKDRIAKQKINVSLDDVSLERVNFTKFLFVII